MRLCNALQCCFRFLDMQSDKDESVVQIVAVSAQALRPRSTLFRLPAMWTESDEAVASMKVYYISVASLNAIKSIRKYCTG